MAQFDDINDALKLLDNGGVPCSKVYDNNDVFNDPEFRENDFLIEAPVMQGITSMDTFVCRGPNATFSKEPGTFQQAAALGEHNYEIMQKYGYSKEEIDRLQSRWSK